LNGRALAQSLPPLYRLRLAFQDSKICDRVEDVEIAKDGRERGIDQ
jgi:hypothetical protein